MHFPKCHKIRAKQVQLDYVTSHYEPCSECDATTGLGELYEAEYLKQALGLKSDEEEQRKKDTRHLFDSLCDKLNALSNFHFTPKRANKTLEVLMSRLINHTC